MSILSGITVLGGDDLSIPTDLLLAHVRHARRGHRLVILDRNDTIAKRVSCKGDVHIDLALGNYDFHDDHRSSDDCEAAAAAMLSSHCDPEILAARPILADTLYRYGSLDDAAGVLRALGHADVRSSLPHRSDDEAAAAQQTWAILKTLRELADDLIVAPDYCRSMSVRRWLALPPTAILFVSYHRSYNVLGRALHARLFAKQLHWHDVCKLAFIDRIEDDDDGDDARDQLFLPLPANPNRTLTIDLDEPDAHPAAPAHRQPATIIPFARAVPGRDEAAETALDEDAIGFIETSLDEALFGSPRLSSTPEADIIRDDDPAPPAGHDERHGSDPALLALTERVAALEARGPVHGASSTDDAGYAGDIGRSARSVEYDDAGSVIRPDVRASRRRWLGIQRTILIGGVISTAGIGWIVYNEPAPTPRQIATETEWVAQAEERLSATHDDPIPDVPENRDKPFGSWQNRPAPRLGGAGGAADTAPPGG